mgnify:CR=1 FL=1
MQQWYKRNYEKHLFKNSGDLHNIMNYIRDMKKEGATDSEIKSKLKETGWTSEQVDYALKKSVGKDTGMWELPVTKIFEKKKGEQEENEEGVEETKSKKRPSAFDRKFNKPF